MSRFQVVIPSHRRADILAAKTLRWLKDVKFDLARVVVVVSDAKDLADYTGLGVRVVATPQAAHNIVDKFNSLHYAYDVGADVMVLEDDVAVIDSTKALASPDALAAAGFAAISNGGIWGIAPHSNTFFFSGRVTDSLKLVVAHAFGFKTTHKKALEVTQLGKSDYERTCKYYIEYGRTVRLDMFGVKTVSYTKPGGIEATHGRDARARAEQASCEYLVRRYPHMLKLNEAKKSLFQELSFLKCAVQPEALREYQAVHEAAVGFADAPAVEWERGWLAKSSS